MNLLLDTHVAIWAVSDTGMIPDRIQEILTDSANRIHVSAISIWEIAIKHAKYGPSRMAFDGHDAIELFTDANFVLLDTTPIHAAAIGKISLDHADPFDRLLVAQAVTEPLAFVTKDRKIAAYSPTFISW
ncbi:type II toxin-antitoxin system VapC family toxin [Rhizobium sp. TRM95111]|uniref:type II toxin-antitoxin system VapC family toxin n=1 Tax=Rhizobium alarense TaxID=2846851 RepID=UPI001F21B41D|nr:type II toxin-antitoxin system VapC family toxin [Rhizobium alarense]MCF3642365.1 type II toxin-antitoxin system VapC family toxin [Rhizobium alarense]